MPWQHWHEISILARGFRAFEDRHDLDLQQGERQGERRKGADDRRQAARPRGDNYG
jgi:hypothetical protein